MRLLVFLGVAVLFSQACVSEHCGTCAAVRGLDQRTCYYKAHTIDGCFSGVGPGPSARYMAALGYDAAANDFVLFGGQTASGTSGETWLFTPPSTWRLVKPAHRPPPRRDAAMAWDPIGHTVLMFGGHVPDNAEGFASDQTWAWDGTDWRQLATGAGGPGHRDGASMVTAGQQVLLFGGHEGNVSYYGDVWTWDGAGWMRVDRGSGPEGRANAGVMWDVNTSSLLVFGGTGLRAGAGPGNLGRPLSDAWSLNDGAWSANLGPPQMLVMPVAYNDPTTAMVEVWGIACPSSDQVGWEFNTGRWVAFGTGGFGRWGVAVATAPDGRVLQFGGSTEKVAC